MPKYRKKPVVIDAEQWNPGVVIEGVEEIKDLTGQTVGIIHTLEGDMTALPGDWIITGVQGEKYPCKPDIFEATYEDANKLSNEDVGDLIDGSVMVLDGLSDGIHNDIQELRDKLEAVRKLVK